MNFKNFPLVSKVVFGRGSIAHESHYGRDALVGIALS